MNRFLFFANHSLAMALLFGTLVNLGAAAPHEGSSRRPNIILIVADDLGYAELGCYGQKLIETPNIDRLAEQGIRFTQFYSGAPVCAPARCTLMTGLHLGHAASRDNKPTRHLKELPENSDWEYPGQNPLPADAVTIGGQLKAAGYATAAIGKWGLGHFGTTGDPNLQGFDLFYGFNCQWHAHNHYPRFLWRNRVKEIQPGNDRTLHGETYSQDQFTKVALQFIRENQDRPFFLYLPFVIPHLGIQVPDESLAWYKDKFPEEPYELGSHYVNHPSPRAGYAAMVTHMDRDIGTITQLVKELGLDGDTLVLFTSDNGPAQERGGGTDSTFFNSAGPFRGRKGSVYEGGIRVPLVARWPGRIAAGQTSDHQSAFWDFLPTLCDIAGTASPSEIDGISMAPALLGQSEQQQHEYLYWEFASYGGQQAIRAGNWKAVRQNISKGNMQIELYNLADDIAEQHDLAEKFPKRVEQLDQLMKDAHVPSETFPLFASEKE